MVRSALSRPISIGALNSHASVSVSSRASFCLARTETARTSASRWGAQASRARSGSSIAEPDAHDTAACTAETRADGVRRESEAARTMSEARDAAPCGKLRWRMRPIADRNRRARGCQRRRAARNRARKERTRRGSECLRRARRRMPPMTIRFRATSNGRPFEKARRRTRTVRTPFRIARRRATNRRTRRQG
jgi:hypothetical protein